MTDSFGRSSMTLETRVAGLERMQSKVYGSMRRIEGQTKGINRETRKWHSNLTASFGKIAAGMAAFRAVSGVHPSITSAAGDWVRRIEEAGQAMKETSTSMRTLLSMTPAGKRAETYRSVLREAYRSD